MEHIESKPRAGSEREGPVQCRTKGTDQKGSNSDTTLGAPVGGVPARTGRARISSPLEPGKDR